MQGRHSLYYFGRACLFISVVLFLEGLLLPRYVFTDEMLKKFPPFMKTYVWIIGTLFPWFALPGIVASIGLILKQNWARIILGGLFVLGAIGSVAFGVFWELWVYQLPSALPALIMGPVVVANIVWYFAKFARQVMTQPFG